MPKIVIYTPENAIESPIANIRKVSEDTFYADWINSYGEKQTVFQHASGLISGEYWMAMYGDHNIPIDSPECAEMMNFLFN